MPRLASLATLLAAPAFAQQVHVVAPGPGLGVDFFSISAAVAAANDGDLVLVRSGTYMPFQIQAKGVCVVEDAGADVRIGAGGAGFCAVSQTLPSQTVWIHGLTSAVPTDLAIDSCAGPVIATGLTWTSTVIGSRITASDAVMLRASQFNGAPGHADCAWVGSACACSQLHAGGPGLFAADARISAYGVVLNGGNGLAASSFWPCNYGATQGGPGLELANSRVLLQSVCQGGQGGAGAALAGGVCAQTGEIGGPGVRVTDATSHIDFTGAIVSHAQSGGVSFPCPSGGPQAPAYDGPPSGLGVLGFMPSLAAPALAREGQSVKLAGAMSPGLALLAVSTQADQLEIPGVLGWAVPTAPALFPVTLTPTGTFAPPTYELTLPIQELGAGVEFVVVHVQALQLDATGIARLGESSPIALLDSQF